jgi:hypothetical protein
MRATMRTRSPRLGTRGHEQRAHAAEHPREAPRAARVVGALDGEDEQQAAAPHAEVERVLHPAEERPVERAHRQDRGREEEARPAQGVARLHRARRGEHPPCREQQHEQRERRDHRRPQHELQPPEAAPIAERQEDRIAQAGVAARVAVALRPLKRIAARERARVVEMDEDVVERRGPHAAGLPQEVAVEDRRGEEGAAHREERVEHVVVAAPPRGEGVEPARGARGLRRRRRQIDLGRALGLGARAVGRRLVLGHRGDIPHLGAPWVRNHGGTLARVAWVCVDRSAPRR